MHCRILKAGRRLCCVWLLHLVAVLITGSGVWAADKSMRQSHSSGNLPADIPADLLPLVAGSQFDATDTLDCGIETRADATACLNDLGWKPDRFQVLVQASAAEGRGDWLIRFPSPKPLGNPASDLVVMEWYLARDADRNPVLAPAVVVVHESGRGMTVGRIIAKGLNAQGLHTFLLHMPGYGARRVEGVDEARQMLPALKQAISDVRRARDAVSALPFIDSQLIGLQGTSLGGFVSATVCGLDTGYDRAFILLAGGDLQTVVLTGAKDAAKARQRLLDAGVSRDQIVEMTRQIEPLRLAHRIRPSTTWLFSGLYDDVVPPACAAALVDAAQLPDGHHVQMPVDHYSGAVLLPLIIQQMAAQMTR